LVNPDKAIPTVASDVHGIKYEDVKDAPTFKDVAKDLVEWMEGCDLGGYNIVRYDIPLLLCEFERAKVEFSLEDRAFVDGYEIFVHFQPHTLAGAYKFYCEGNIRDAHTAMGDVMTTWQVIAEQLNKYNELCSTMSGADAQDVVHNKDAIDLQSKLKWKDDEVCINFGKHNGAKPQERSQALH